MISSIISERFIASRFLDPSFRSLARGLGSYPYIFAFSKFPLIKKNQQSKFKKIKLLSWFLFLIDTFSLQYCIDAFIGEVTEKYNNTVPQCLSDVFVEYCLLLLISVVQQRSIDREKKFDLEWSKPKWCISSYLNVLRY